MELKTNAETFLKKTANKASYDTKNRSIVFTTPRLEFIKHIFRNKISEN